VVAAAAQSRTRPRQGGSRRRRDEMDVRDGVTLDAGAPWPAGRPVFGGRERRGNRHEPRRRAGSRPAENGGGSGHVPSISDPLAAWHPRNRGSPTRNRALDLPLFIPEPEAPPQHTASTRAVTQPGAARVAKRSIPLECGSRVRTIGPSRTSNRPRRHREIADAGALDDVASIRDHGFERPPLALSAWSSRDDGRSGRDPDEDDDSHPHANRDRSSGPDVRREQTSAVDHPGQAAPARRTKR